MAEDGHRESGERGGVRGQANFAALAWQGDLSWHEVQLPSLAAGVKLLAPVPKQRKFLFYSN